MANPVNLGAKPPIVPIPDNGTRKTGESRAPTGRFDQTLATNQKNVKKLARKKLQARLTLQKREHARLAEQKRQQAANGARVKGGEANVAARDARPSDAAMRRPMEQATENLLKQQQEKDGAHQDGQGSGQQRQQPEHQDDASPRTARGRAGGRPITNTANLASDTGSRSIVHRENIRLPAPRAVEQDRHSPFAMNLLMRQTPKSAHIERPGDGRPSTTDRLRIAPPPGQHHAIELNLRELTPHALTERSTQQDGKIREVAPHQANPLLFGRAVIHFNGHHELSREVIVRYTEGSQGARAELVDPRQSDVNSAQGVLQLRQVKAARDNDGVAVYTPSQPVTLLRPGAGDTSRSDIYPLPRVISPAAGLHGGAGDQEAGGSSRFGSIKRIFKREERGPENDKLKDVIDKFDDDAPDRDGALAHLLSMDNGVRTLIKLGPPTIGRDTHCEIFQALGSIGGARALSVLASAFRSDAMPHVWTPAAKAIRTLVQDSATLLSDDKAIKTTTKELLEIAPTLIKTNGFSYHRFEAIISALPALVNTYDSDEQTEHTAIILRGCIRQSQAIGDVDRCNVSFRALLELAGSSARNHLLSIPPHPEWIKQTKQLLPGELFVKFLSTGDKNAAQALLELINPVPAASHIQSLTVKNIVPALAAFPPTEIHALTRTILDNPDQHENALSELFKLSSVSLNLAKETWSATSRTLLRASLLTNTKLTSPPTSLAAELDKRLMDAKRATPIQRHNLFSELRQDGWEMDRFLGRTLVFKKDDNYKAIKVQKDGESRSELHRQCEVVRFLQEKREELDLKSESPNPEGVFEVGDLDQFLVPQRSDNAEAVEQFLAQIHRIQFDDQDFMVNAYVYECQSDDYFRYLHQAESSERFGQAASTSLHDLICLLKECDLIFPQLADIFHFRGENHEDRPDGGRYRALQFDGITCGDIDDWQASVEFVNLRASGLADEGDCDRLKELLDAKGSLAKRFFADLPAKFGDQAPALKLAGIIGEYLLVLELSAGKCALALTANSSKEEAADVWDSMAGEMRNLYGQCLSQLSGAPREKTLHLLDTVTDWKQYSRQMQFWMTDEFTTPVSELKIPEDIYGSHVKTSVEADLVPRSVRARGGFKNDPAKGPNLGARSGINPLMEAEKTRFAVATFALLLQEGSDGGNPM